MRRLNSAGRLAMSYQERIFLKNSSRLWGEGNDGWGMCNGGGVMVGGACVLGEGDGVGGV